MGVGAHLNMDGQKSYILKNSNFAIKLLKLLSGGKCIF